MPNLPLMNVDLAVTASRFKGKASAALNHAGHLQNIGAENWFKFPIREWHGSIPSADAPE